MTPQVSLDSLVCVCRWVDLVVGYFVILKSPAAGCSTLQEEKPEIKISSFVICSSCLLMFLGANIANNMDPDQTVPFGFWFYFMLNVPVNSYGHIGTVSSPNHTFFLGKLDYAVNQ